MQKTNKQPLSILDFILSAIPAFAMTAATDYIETGNFTVSVGYVLASAALFAILLCAAFLLRRYLLNLKPIENRDKGIFKLFAKLMRNRFHVLITAILIVICWFPALFFLYPGTLINDTWGELIQFIKFTNGELGLDNHHPLFDTFLMGSLIVPLSQKTGEWHFVIFSYVLIQSFLTALAFSFVIDYSLNKLNAGTKAASVMFLWFCLMPIYPASTQTISKDALHTWIFVFYSLQFMEAVRTEGTELKKPGFLILFTLSSVFCCLTKKIGIYVIVASLVFLFLFIKKNRWTLLIPVLCSVLVMNIILPAVITRLDVYPGGVQEKYSLPFQMTARVFIDYPEDVTPEEYAAVDKVLYPEEMVEVYDPTWADPVKHHSQKGEKEDYSAYLKVWLQMGLRHPDSYLAAANSMLAGWFSWTKYAPLMNMEHRNQLDSRYLPKWIPIRYISEKSALSYEMMFEKLYENPFTRLFFTYGFYATLAPAFFAGTVFRRWKTGKRYWLAVLPLFFSLALGCWLAPASVHLEGKRYLYPITYTIPLVCMWCLHIYCENRLGKDQ